MSWLGPPHPLERWQEKKRPFQIRTVVERNVNGDVVYILGRINSYNPHQRCTEKEWHEWAKNATKK